MNDTGKVKLPGLPRVSSGNAALDSWIQAVSERLEVREGARGNPYERVVTVRELTALGLDATQWGRKTGTAISGVMVQSPDGTFTRVPIDAFADEIRKTRLYRDLTLAIDDATRFDGVPDQVKAILLDNIADEAAKRGADIQRLDKKIQSTTESLAYTVQEVTAAVKGAAAGVRDVSYASANANAATAGKVTQVTARLDNFSDGTPGVATVEAKMTATASRVTGLAAEYMVKVSAGGAIAGFGLAASEDLTGTTESSFMVMADTFSVVAPYNYVQNTTPGSPSLNQTWYNTVALPDANHHVSKRWNGSAWVTFTPIVPFGVRASGVVYINADVEIDGVMNFSQITGPTKPADGATKNIMYRQTTAPTGGTYSTGDMWIDTDSVPTAIAQWDGAAWALVSNYVNNTSQITDGANLGGTSVWSGVTGTGKPADGATVNNVTYSATAPASPVNGDIWVDTTAAPYIVKIRVSGVWQAASNYTTNTNQLTDGANLGGTAAWTGVSSVPTGVAAAASALDASGTLVTKVVPAAVAGTGVGLRMGSDYMGYHNGATWKTYMDNAGNFYLGGATGGSLSWNGTTLNIIGNITGTGSIDISGIGKFSGATAYTGPYGTNSAVVGLGGVNVGVFGSTSGAHGAVIGHYSGTSYLAPGILGTGGRAVTGYCTIAGGAGGYFLNYAMTYSASLANDDGAGTFIGPTWTTGQGHYSIATGTSPFVITSTTVNTNLNSDMLDGYHAADIISPAPERIVTSGSHTIAGTSRTVLLDVNGGAVTLTMPASPTNGQEVSISTWYTQTALTHVANTGHTIQGALSSTMAAGTGGRWVFMSATGTWWRLDNAA